MPDPSPDTPSAIVDCPQCGKPSRVPESLFDTPVRCRECGAIYTAPKRGPDGQLGPARLPITPATHSRMRFRDSPLVIPGLLLFMVGLVGAFFDAGMYYSSENRREEMLEGLKAAMADPNNQFHKQMENFTGRELGPNDVSEERLQGLSNHAAFFIPVNLLIIAGSLAVLFRRGYRLALVGSGAAMVNFGFACCILSAPIGLFALVKLLDPDSKKLFR